MDPTYCNDGATLEPWCLADFAEANAEDPECAAMLACIEALDVGESTAFGGGAIAITVVTRLS